MPNHVINEVTLHEIPLAASRPYIFDQAGKVGFDTLLPLPLNFWAGSVGKEHRDAFAGNHLDAATAIWGTKWGPYGDPTALEVDGSTVMTFKTAWSPPRGWICALFNTLKCDITAYWFDEGQTHARMECYKYDALGQYDWKIHQIDAGTSEHRRLHKMLWGVEDFDSQGEVAA